MDTTDGDKKSKKMSIRPLIQKGFLKIFLLILIAIILWIRTPGNDFVSILVSSLENRTIELGCNAVKSQSSSDFL